MTDKKQPFQSDTNESAHEKKPHSPRRERPYPKSDNPTMADGYGRDMSDCGDLIEFYLNINGDIVTTVTCRARGCQNTHTSARAAGMLVKNQSIQNAMKLASPENINDLVKLPEPNRHCADLASNAMKTALKDAASNAREPWRKLYRKT